MNQIRGQWHESHGWRTIIGDGFTFDSVRILAQAIADYIKERTKIKRDVVIGYDSRFLSDKFAQIVASVLAGNGLKVWMTNRPTPTPVIAYELLKRESGGGVNITASHNPPEYSGMKCFSTLKGGWKYALINKEIKERFLSLPLKKVKEISYEQGIEAKSICLIDPMEDYLKYLKSLVDIDLFKKANLKVVINPMHGTACGYLERIFKEIGCECIALNTKMDPLFGGSPPDPSEVTLKDTAELVVKNSAHLGLATDGDADRFGVVDEKGIYLDPNKVFALILFYLLKTKGWKGKVAKTITVTHLVDAICKKYHCSLIETSIGFKYIGEAIQEGAIIGGEESGGMAVKGHIPEKDGILGCLLMAEMVAVEKKPLSKILQELYAEFGTFFYKKMSLYVTDKERELFLMKLTNNPPTEFAGIAVKRVVSENKFILEDGSWVTLRASQTEPVIRCYAETNNNHKLEKMLESGSKFIKGT
ncbi:MAG: phosphoglucomutase/phosphomannomutase family protein [bacterium]